MPIKWEPKNPKNLIKRYLSGESVLKLAAEVGVSRPAFTRFLKRNEIPLRTASEQELIKWAGRRKQSDYRDIVEAQCGAAWVGSQKPHTLAQRIKSAATRSRTVSHDERALIAALKARGVRVNAQHPIGPYNTDFTVHACPIAVEVQRGESGGRRSGSMKLERLEHILDRGWALLIVYIPGGVTWVERKPLTFDFEAVADQCVAFIDLVCSDPSMVGQYGMIGRNGQPTTPRGFKFDSRPRVRGF